MDRSRSRKSLVLRRIALWTGLSAAALVLSGAVFVSVFDWNWLKSAVTQRVADASHRDFAIEGDIEGEWRLIPRIAATGIRIGNAPWAGASDMLRVERLEFRIDLVQLIKGSVVLPEVKIVGAEIDLQKNAEGMANWDFSPVSEAGAVAEATKSARRAARVISKIGEVRVRARPRS